MDEHDNHNTRETFSPPFGLKSIPAKPRLLDRLSKDDPTSQKKPNISTESGKRKQNPLISYVSSSDEDEESFTRSRVVIELSAKHFDSQGKLSKENLMNTIEEATKQRSSKPRPLSLEFLVDLTELEHEFGQQGASQVTSTEDFSYHSILWELHEERVSFLVKQSQGDCSVSERMTRSFSEAFRFLREFFPRVKSVDLSHCTLPTQVALLHTLLSAFDITFVEWSYDMKFVCTFSKDFFHLKENEFISIINMTKPMVVKGEVSKRQFQELISYSLMFLTEYNEKITHALIAAGAGFNMTDKDGKTALFYATENHNEEIALALIAAGADVNITDKDGNTALFYAILSDNEKIALGLIEAGADVNVTDKDGKTALFYATYFWYHEKIALALIEAGADVNMTDNDGKTALFYATDWNKDKVALALIAAGADVNMTNKYGKTALFYATDRNNKKIIALGLIEAGADVNVTDKHGKTALFYAILRNNEKIILGLIAAGADVNMTDNDGKTALFYATDWNKDKVALALIAAGADVNMTNKYGKTALFYATDTNNKKIIALGLIEAGADVNVTDKHGKTALFYAILRNNEKIALAMIEAGADVNMTDKDGKTALFYAVLRNNEKIILGLIAAGADVNITDKDGETPLFYTTTKYNEKIALALIEAGADVNITDKDGKTALFYAIRRDSEKIALVLIEAGADVNVTDKDGKTALFYATVWYNEKAALALIEAGADVNVTDEDGKTVLLHFFEVCGENLDKPLRSSSREFFRGVIQLLLANGASICETTEEEESVFHFILKCFQQTILSAADEAQKQQIFKELEGILKLFSQSDESEVAVNKRDIKLNSPVHLWALLPLAPSNDHFGNACYDFGFESPLKEILDLFLECGVKVDESNENKEKPLHLCSTWTAVKLLLEAGAEPNASDLSECTPLVAAAKRNTCIEKDSERFYPDVTQSPKEFWKEVIDKELDPWSADKNGNSVLSILLQKEAHCLAKALIEAACELQCVQSDGIGLPLLFTICSDDSVDKVWKVDLVKTLLKYRSNLAQERVSGEDTALHFCCTHMVELPEDSINTSVHWDIARHLILCGAHVQNPGKEGQSCMDMAENCPVLKELLSMSTNLEEVPPLIDSWKTTSEKHRDQLTKVSRGFNCQQIETVYYFKEALDDGTFGLMFVGINVEDGKEVAVKRVEKLRVDKESTQKEIEELRQVTSCNKIIECLLCTSDKDFLYVILELMEGNLGDLLSDEYPPPSPHIIQKTKLCGDICTGLDYLHSRDIVHKGIKPTNVLYQVLRPSGINLKLAFFGLRSQMSKEQHASDYTDTYECLIKERCWMAPEVLQSQSHSKSSDVFSCGLVIHYLLSNKKHPFGLPGSSEESLLAVSIETVDNIAQHKMELDEAIPSDTKRFLLQMLDHSPASRVTISNALKHYFFQCKS